jgi:hypothetical protein
VYIFANDLGSITVESWSTSSGAYSGAVGPNFPLPPQAWPTGFKPGYAIGEVHTRSTHPAFGGDLLFVSPLGLNQNGFPFVNKPVIHVINTGSHQLVEQIVPPASVTSIYDFTLGPGTLGPKSRAYINTEDGMFAFNETATGGFVGFDPITFQPVFDNSHFQLASATPLLTNLSSTASFDIGPTDGYLYVLDGAGSASSIKRYNTTTGGLVDTFLTFAQYNYGGVVADNLKFGPDGGLYLSSTSSLTQNSRLVISRFDSTTGLRTNDYDLGMHFIDDFYPLAIPEPSTLSLLIFGVLLLWQRTRHC